MMTTLTRWIPLSRYPRYLTFLTLQKACSSLRRFAHFRQAKVTERKVKIRDADVNVVIAGNGKHPVFCIPGVLGCSKTDFGPVLSLFSQKFTVISWDPIGLGKSRPAKRNLSGGIHYYYREAHWAFELMQILGYRRFSLIGFSDGGRIATIIAAKHPEAVIRLITISTSAYTTKEELARYKKMGKIDSWSKRRRNMFIKQYGRPLLQEMADKWVDLMEQIVVQSGGDIIMDELSKVTCPTLIVHGERDPLVPYYHAEYLHNHIANSWMYTVPRGKHDPHLKHPKEFVPFAEYFLLGKAEEVGEHT